MNAADWQLIDLYCLLSMTSTLDGPDDLKTCLFLYVFLIRSAYIDDEDYEELKTQFDLKKALFFFLRVYSRTFGRHTMTFNLHSFQHIFECREQHGPLWKYHTGPFESLYGKLKRMYCAQTRNVTKQILTHNYSNLLVNHLCRTQKRPFFSTERNEHWDNSLVVYNNLFYRVMEHDEENDEVTLRKIETLPLDTSQYYKLPWKMVGYRQYLREGESIIKVKEHDITCNAIVVESLICSYYVKWTIL